MQNMVSYSSKLCTFMSLWLSGQPTNNRHLNVMSTYLQFLKYAVLHRIPKYQKKLTDLLANEKLKSTLIDLSNKGLEFGAIYDIGARHAEWSTALKKTFPKSSFFLFEANEKCTKILNDSGFKFFIGALSSEIKTVDFYHNDSTGDSYYKENTSFYEEVKPIKKQTITLDSIVRDQNIALPDFIKLDTQGSELDILAGGIVCLRHASLVYIELPILSYNLGAPNFLDYIEFMKMNNFVPYDICELHYSNGVMIQVDILFIREGKLSKINPSFNPTLYFL